MGFGKRIAELLLGSKQRENRCLPQYGNEDLGYEDENDKKDQAEFDDSEKHIWSIPFYGLVQTNRRFNITMGTDETSVVLSVIILVPGRCDFCTYSYFKLTDERF
jgi:hypothetical protein